MRKPSYAALVRQLKEERALNAALAQQRNEARASLAAVNAKVAELERAEKKTRQVWESTLRQCSYMVEQAGVLMRAGVEAR